MQNWNTHPKFIVKQTFKHLEGIYGVYSLVILGISWVMWVQFTSHEMISIGLHIFITILLIATPCILIISEKKHSIYFYTNHLELRNSTGEYLAEIAYKDIKQCEFQQRGGRAVMFGCSIFTYFYISDGETSIKLQAMSLKPSDRLYLERLIQGVIN